MKIAGRRPRAVSARTIAARDTLAAKLEAPSALAAAAAAFVLLRPASTAMRPDPVTANPPEATVAYRCDGRTRCSQMTSCAEATWFLKHCTNTEMDGNRDGIPCESQWCTGPLGR